MMDKETLLSDPDIRSVLRSRISLKYAADADTVIIEELGLLRGQVRIDVSVVNGLLHGYEIKSDRDSLYRLRTQVTLYGKVLDRATLVVGDRHLAEALKIVPPWWGILHFHSLAKKLQLKVMRSPRNNPQRDPRALVELLWLDDAIALLEARDAVRGVRGKARRVVWDRVCEVFAVEEIATAVRAHLKMRARNQVPALP